MVDIRLKKGSEKVNKGEFVDEGPSRIVALEESGSVLLAIRRKENPAGIYVGSITRTECVGNMI